MGFRHINGDWHTIAVGWKGIDDRGNEVLTIQLNESLKEGERIYMRVNRKRPGKKDPDYTYFVKYGQYDPKEMEVLTRQAVEKKQQPSSDDIADDIPF